MEGLRLDNLTSKEWWQRNWQEDNGEGEVKRRKVGCDRDRAKELLQVHGGIKRDQERMR